MLQPGPALGRQASARPDLTVRAPAPQTGAKGATTEDVSGDGSLVVGEARLYHLVHLDSPTAAIVTIAFDAPGARAYAFTFGG
jgi:hypothetical protein